MRYIDNLEDLDRELAIAEQRFALSDDEGRRYLDQIHYRVDAALPADPHSPAYQEAQLRLYTLISGRAGYSVVNEQSEFVEETHRTLPFPYTTGSSQTVGDQLIAWGYLIKSMGLKPGASIVEFGPGWGNTTMQLAWMGYDVTAVDVEQRFIELIRHRGQDVTPPLKLHSQDMLDFAAPTTYDAALFFECFHHCSDHLAMLKKLDQLVAPDGLIAFAGEPIGDYPYPWGIRLDGLAIWSIRRYGWLELGFDKSYFLRTLLQLGWSPRLFQSDASPLAHVIVARRSAGLYRLAELSLPPDEEWSWHAPQGEVRFSKASARLSCQRDLAVRGLELSLLNAAPHELVVSISAGGSTRQVTVPPGSQDYCCQIGLEGWDGHVQLSCATWVPHQHFNNNDQRELGIGVRSIRLIHGDEPVSEPASRPPQAGEPQQPASQIAQLRYVAGDPYLTEQLHMLRGQWEVRPQPATGLLGRLRTRLAWWLLGPELRQINQVHALFVRIVDSLVSKLRA